MAVTFNEAGIANVPIGGFTDVIRTGELFERTFDHVDECGQPRDFSNLDIQSAIVFDALTLATVANMTASFGGDPTLGQLTLSVADADMPAAGQYMYRVRAQPTGSGTPLRTIQDGRFTVGEAAP